MTKVNLTYPYLPLGQLFTPFYPFPFARQGQLSNVAAAILHGLRRNEEKKKKTLLLIGLPSAEADSFAHEHPHRLLPGQ